MGAHGPAVAYQRSAFLVFGDRDELVCRYGCSPDGGGMLASQCLRCRVIRSKCDKVFDGVGGPMHAWLDVEMLFDNKYRFLMRSYGLRMV